MTHFSISLCNYLHSRFLARTAYLEVNTTHAIGTLSPEKDPTIPFRRKGVSYYPDVLLSELPGRLSLHHKYRVLDFGVLTPYTLVEFARCDLCIVLTNVSIWKDRQLARFLEETKLTNLGKDKKIKVCFLCQGDQKNDRKRILRAYGIRVVPVPFLENPFQVSSIYFGFFEQLWKQT